MTPLKIKNKKIPLKPRNGLYWPHFSNNLPPLRGEQPLDTCTRAWNAPNLLEITRKSLKIE